jgi:hypothetical protein
MDKINGSDKIVCAWFADKGVQDENKKDRN